MEIIAAKPKPKWTIKEISSRECEILKLIASGLSSTEIAEKLFISDHTVISHRRNLIRKFHARNSAHMIARAFQRKIFKIKS